MLHIHPFWINPQFVWVSDCCCRFSVNQKSVLPEMSAFILPFNSFDSELFSTFMFYGPVRTFLSSLTFISLYELCGRYTLYFLILLDILLFVLICHLFNVFPAKQNKIHNLNINAQSTSLCHRQN